MYHKNLLSAPAAAFTHESPMRLTVADSPATFISSAAAFSAVLTRGRTYFLNAECDGFMGRWGEASDGASAKLMRLYLVSADGADGSTDGRPGAFVPKQTGAYYVKVVAEGAGETRSAWNFSVTEAARASEYAPPPDAAPAGAGQIKIFAPGGGALGIFPLLEAAVRKTELMGEDTVTLQWDDECADDEEELALPLGAYVVVDGVKFRLLAPYEPQRPDELTRRYEPVFHSPMSALTTKPFFFYMEELCETDFNINGEFKEFTDALAKAILRSTGETWEVSAPADLGTRSLSFSQQTIFGAVGDIADAFGCEWTAGEARISFVKDATSEDARTLTVGVDVAAPSSSDTGADYHNRYYAFGSTRNIVRSDYSSLNASVTSLSEPRLKLPRQDWVDSDGTAVAGCPGGYVDYDDGAALTPAERNACVKVYDDIYPQSDLKVAGVTAMTKKGDDGEEYPVYKLTMETAAGAPFSINTSTYDKEGNPDGHLISGLNVSVSFSTGLLQGKEFEVGVSPDGAAFTIVPDTSEEIMVPNNIIVPREGDACVLFNIRMPDSYREEAERRLYRRLVEDMEAAHSRHAAMTLTSIAAAGVTGLGVADKIVVLHGRDAVTTRVVGIERHLDVPSEWSITTGDAVRTSRLRTMQESVARLSGAAAGATRGAARANRAAWKASQELLGQVFDPEGSFFTETIKPLVVQTANVTVGTRSQQFVIDNLLFHFDNGERSGAEPSFNAEAEKDSVTPRLMHYAIDPDGVRTWALNKSYTLAYGQPSTTLGAAFDFGPTTPGCYIYAVCAKFKQGSDPAVELNGHVVLTDRQVLAEPAEDAANYWFLLGMLSSEIVTDGVVSRSVTLTFGETTINGRHIRTGRIESVDGSTGMDLDKGEIFGNIRLAPSASDEANKAFIDSLLGYSADKASMEGGIASAKTAASAAKDKVDGLAVGGRNYLLRTAAAWGVTGKGAGASENYTVYNYKAASAAAFTKGATVTISFDYDNAVTGGAANILVHDMWRLLIALTPSNAGSGRFSATLTLGADVALSHPIYIQGKWDGGFTISNAKWEAGNVPTSWTPAPEDVDSAIGAAQTAADGARDAVDGMVVGGRNYILKTATPAAYKSVTTSQFVVRLGLISAGLAQRQVAMGESITVSFEFRTDGKVDGSGAQWVVINGSGQWRTLGYTPQFEDTGGAWVRRSHTWRWGDSFSQAIKDAPKDLAAGDEFVIGCNPSSSVVNIGIRRLKLEVGNKRTDWEPAPEDVDDAIEAAKKAAVEEVDVMYALGASATTAPTSGWQTTAPAWQAGKYMWQRTDITTGDGVLHTGAPTCIQGAAGATGATGAAGRGIKSVQEQYYLSTSRTAQTGGSWQTAQPAWSAGMYVWTRSLITYSDGTTGYSSATLSELFNKANETAAAASSAAGQALALAGDPDNVFTDQFLTGLSNTSDVAPPKGKARLCNNRDNWFGNEIAVSQGAKVVIEATVMRHPSDTSTIPPRFGLWLTDKDDGINPWGWYSLGEDMGVVGMAADWHKWRRVATVPGGMRKGRFFLQIERSATLDGQNTQGSFYVSNIVVKMEARDYLREALEEASSGTTDVSGGLVLSKMMSVRDANGVMVAGMSGAAAAAETGALPMIWAGADESSTKGVGAADFRVYKDGSIIMHSAQILGKAGEPAVTVSKGNISVGTMNAAADGLASVGTEIIPDSYASVADVLNGLAGGGGALSAGGTVNKTLELAYSQMTKMGLAAKRTSTTYTQVLYSGTTASTGTVWVGFTSGKYSLAGKVTANAGTGLGSASLSVFISVVLQVGDSKVTLASRDAMARLGNSTSSMTSNLAPAVSETGDLPTNVASLPFTKGQAWKVYVEAYWEAASLYYYAMPDNPFTVSTTPTAALTNAAIRISDVQAAYRNKIFRNGLVMSKSNANYLVVASDSSSPLLEARAGTSTTANAGVRLAAGGVQVNFNGTASSAWHEAFPLYAVVLVTFTTNVAGNCSFLYNPHNMPTPKWDRENTGIYTLSWDSPDTTLYPNFQAMTSTQRYVSVRSIAAKSITVGIGDDDTTNDMATGDKFLVFLYKF